MKSMSNVERSAAMRARILEATISCLHKLGYHQTSTVMVTKEAGVSRGALLHHFPSKAALMMAVAERVAESRGELHRKRLTKSMTTRERFLVLIDVFWEAMLSPSGIARLELMLSTRSDPELADHFEEMNDRLDRVHKGLIWFLAKDLGLSSNADRLKMDAFVQLYTAAVRGLAIDALRDSSREGANASIELLKEFQITMLDQMLAR